jgi:uncharacterized membrane protein YkoI
MSRCIRATSFATTVRRFASDRLAAASMTDSGVFKACARSAAPARDSQSDARILTAEEVIALLEAEGYTDVRDLDLEDALWEAEVKQADGTDVELRINGFSGQILSVDKDD